MLSVGARCAGWGRALLSSCPVPTAPPPLPIPRNTSAAPPISSFNRSVMEHAPTFSAGSEPRAEPLVGAALLRRFCNNLTHIYSTVGQTDYMRLHLVLSLLSDARPAPLVSECLVGGGGPATGHQLSTEPLRCCSEPQAAHTASHMRSHDIAARAEALVCRPCHGCHTHPGAARRS